MAHKIAPLVAAAPLLVLGLTGCGTTSEASAAAPHAYTVPGADTVAMLRSTIMKYAAAMGDASPSDLHYYATNLSLVLQAEGGTRRSDDAATPVFVLTAHGTFTSSRPRPPGSPAPTGTTLMVTLDAVTLHQLELGLGASDPDLSNLGPAHAF